MMTPRKMTRPFLRSSWSAKAISAQFLHLIVVSGQCYQAQNATLHFLLLL